MVRMCEWVEIALVLEGAIALEGGANNWCMWGENIYGVCVCAGRISLLCGCLEG